MEGIRVSIVMAVYNAANRAVLDAAIESIVNQTIAEWELLICDDGSCNDTPKWLNDWRLRDSRIRVFHLERNRGAAYARNRCIREARGSYIAIMDADDVSAPNRLQVQTDFLKRNPQVDFVGLKGRMFEREIGDRQKAYWTCPAPQPRDFRMTLPFVHASLMFRREALEAVGGYRERKWVCRSEDYDMLMRMYAKGMRGVNVEEAVYFIREDAQTFKRRKYRYRVTEMLVKMVGFTHMGLMPAGLVYAVKPLVVGLMPARVVELIKRRYYGK